MFKIITAARKELLLLKRDRTGLLVLFLMPALLVIVITLVQENVMELTGQRKTPLLLLNLDDGDLGKSLEKQLTAGHIEIVSWDKNLKNLADMQAAIKGGDYQVGVFIPEASTDKVNEEAALILQRSTQHEELNITHPVPVHVFFDPGIMPGLRSGLTAQLQVALEMIAMEKKMQRLDEKLSNLLGNYGAPAEFGPLPEDGFSGLLGQSLFSLEDNIGNTSSNEMVPYNPVQQNVPAWALFGMFFTAIPIAGAILQERKSGLWVRLASLPVSQLALLGGKVVAYTGVCLSQFLIVGLIGYFLFPYLGLPAFSVSESFMPVLLTLLCSSLAACGVGIFLGMVCSSYEQASTLGSTAVVVAAAIGGVMVPVYAMPQMMKNLSVISPLNWALTALQDLLVRKYTISAVWDNLGLLVLFFVLTLLFAWKLARPQI